MGAAVREDTPGYIAKAFPKLFPHGTGDFHELRQQFPKLLSFEEWGRFVMMWHDGRFMRHSRFRYWLLDTSLRMITPTMKRTFFKTREAATQYTLADLANKDTRKNLVQQMSSATSKLPGSVGERRKMRQELEAMVHQIETETADNGENAGAGRIPAGFSTMTCAVYKWEQLHTTILKSYPPGSASDTANDAHTREYYEQWRYLPEGSDERELAMKKTFYELALHNPGVVAWYCTLKLEMAVHLAKEIITRMLQEDIVPGKEDAMARLGAELQQKLGLEVSVDDLPDMQYYGYVDDFYASLEWSAGGLIHTHIAFWIVGSPRIDKVVVPTETESDVVEIDVTPEEAFVLPQERAANIMATFWDRAFTEFNVAKHVQEAAESAAAAQPVNLRTSVGVRSELGKKQERASKTPESISWPTFAHCLLGELSLPTEEAEKACWDELGEILDVCARPDWPKEICTPGSASVEARRALARKTFVAALAEWVNMHDLHAPFPMGPPGKDQACATVDNEHSKQERCSCNKLYPRKCIAPGLEEINEDPRRRDLYRVWLGRNCHFINNFVPLLLLAMLSNMDFQATLTKDAVIEYMTKYMTKSGQGSLVKVMEHSFSLCIEKAREQMQGAGSAMLRWFNLQSLTEVKSQLETMHLIFGVPRFFSSRDFRDLWLKSEIRQVKSKEQIAACETKEASLTSRSSADVYTSRFDWKLPASAALLDMHPTSKRPLWVEILAAAGRHPAEGDSLSNHNAAVAESWDHFLHVMGWWQFKRYYNRAGPSIKYKTRADVVVVHPVGRFTTAQTDVQWRDACYWTLLAHCNHGDRCNTFCNADHLSTFTDSDMDNLVTRFVTATTEERAQRRLAQCPPHVRKNWQLGVARKQRAEERKQPHSKVAASMAKITFVFEEDGVWHSKQFSDMSVEEQEFAAREWREAEEPGPASSEDPAKGDEAIRALSEEDADIQIRMKDYMTKALKWTHKELHDAVVIAGLRAPEAPSLVNYFAALHHQFSDDKLGFLPQNFQSHTSKRIQDVLRCLSRTGLKLGGKLSDKKGVLAERLAHWLNKVLEAGRNVPAPKGEYDIGDGEEGASDADDGVEQKPHNSKQVLVEHTGGAADVPFDASVTPEQAESALGHVQATDFDADIFETLDEDQKEEEMALMGRVVNPPLVDYDCLAWSPASDDELAKTMGWHPGLPLRPLTAADFACTGPQVRATFEASLAAQQQQFVKDMDAPDAVSKLADAVASLDPTQRLAYETMADWAQRRYEWERAPDSVSAPGLEFLLLGTAGTGKTHTAKAGITKVRHVFQDFNAVLTVAFSGVAAANLGSGSRTIDSVFHTNTEDAAKDLVGDALDHLVNALRSVRLVLIDEISTVGAAQFAIVARRLQQVGRVLWRERFRRDPPEDLGTFGGMGVVLMGDFAQLPPVLSSSLLEGIPLQESTKSNRRFLALTGRRIFSQFEQVLRLRRIHRQKGADPFKESTMRLRDAAQTKEDHDLWHTHSVDDCDSPDDAPWPGGEGLLKDALYLVADNTQAGRINGNQLASVAPSLLEPSSASSMSVVVRCEARHNNERGANKKADAFRNVRKALHLCVGARVFLVLNSLWGVSTVSLGLMNGARGVVVAILYAAPNSCRADGNELAGTGYPFCRTAPGSASYVPPRGLDQCPLPNFVVVHFPDYVGEHIFPGLPRTWVPVPTEEVRCDQSKQLLRVGCPLKLARAMTFHKCQGITCHEGTVLSFKDTKMPMPVARLGLAFVGWTRACEWAKVAFMSLPPLDHFLAMRLQPAFRARSSFEEKADKLHDAFLLSHGVDQQQHIQAHQQHLAHQIREKDNRDPSADEMDDIAHMLNQGGVAPVPDSIMKWAQVKTGRSSGLGLTAIVEAFRRDRKIQNAGDKAKSKQSASNKKKGVDIDWSTLSLRVTLEILQEMDFPQDHVQEALRMCGSRVQACIEYCLSKAQDEESKPVSDSSAVLRDEASAAETLGTLGFSLEECTRALEICDFSFTFALKLLLFGGDADRTKYLAKTPFRKHFLKGVKKADVSLAKDSVREEYTERALADLGLATRVVDFGQHAGQTSNACFWLCLAAGLAASSWSPNCVDNGQALPAVFDNLLAETRAMDLQLLDKKAAGRSIKHTALGSLAAALRQHFCANPTPILLRPDMMGKIYQAFAGLREDGPQRTINMYRKWVGKLATDEFADELVLVAVAIELRIRIVCVPYTPTTASRPWVITTYQDVASVVPDDRNIYLGNNDVHYMWLSRAPG